MPDSPGAFTMLEPGGTMYWDTVVSMSSDFTSDGTTNQQSITGLTFAALANSKYEVECVLNGQCTGTLGTFFAISFSAAGATGTFLVFGSASVSSEIAIGNVIGTATTSVNWTTATTDAGVIIKSIVIIGSNAGNITVDVKKQTSGTTTIRAKSRMKIKKVA